MNINDFVTIVPAAGHGRRFQEAGFTHAMKPDLVIQYKDVDTAKMIDWCLNSLPSHYYGHVVLAAHPEVLGPDTRSVLRMIVNKSRGQAHSLLCAMDGVITTDHPVLILNSDMAYSEKDVIAITDAVIFGADIGILTTMSDDPALSYVDDFPYARRFAEKHVISPHAMVGAWAFRSSDALREGLRQICANQYEPYLSGAMNKMRGIFRCVSATKYLDFGTPEKIAAIGAKIVVPEQEKSNEN